VIYDVIHEQYEADGLPVLFRCRECGRIDMSLGTLHAHAEKHRGYTRWNIQLPFGKTSPADFKRLMKLTEVLRVDSTKEIELDEVEEL